MVSNRLVIKNGETMGKSTYKRVHKNKWAGVYYYELEQIYNKKNDICYYISYKNGRKLVWEKIGKASEGYNPEIASEMRAERVRAIRHGEIIKSAKELRQEKLEHDQIFKDVAVAYFEVKGPTLKGIVTDKNRYEKHLAPRFDKKHIHEITPQMIEVLQKDLSDHKNATIWNVLELLNRLINFGVKTNRCPSLSFRIEKPKKDNDKIEYLKPDEAKRFLDVVNFWPDLDVRHMVLVAFYTGMRRGEIFKLQVDDIDFHLKLIKIRDPKGTKTVSIGLSSLVEEIIKKQLEWKNETFPESLYVFPGRTGELRKDCGAVDNIKKAAGLPKDFRPFHGLRHHFAVSLANSGYGLNELSEMLTHKNPAFTKKKYGQFLPESLVAMSNDAVNILNNGGK